MSLFEATKKRSNNLEKLFHALITIKPKSVEPERAFSAMGLFVTKLRNRMNDENSLIVMRQCYKNHWKTVLTLINNSLLNCAGTNSSNFTTRLSFHRWKSHSFQNPKQTGLPGFLFSATRNPGLKILPQIRNTTWMTTSYFARRRFKSMLNYAILKPKQNVRESFAW